MYGRLFQLLTLQGWIKQYTRYDSDAEWDLVVSNLEAELSYAQLEAHCMMFE